MAATSPARGAVAPATEHGHNEVFGGLAGQKRTRSEVDEGPTPTSAGEEASVPVNGAAGDDGSDDPAERTVKRRHIERARFHPLDEHRWFCPWVVATNATEDPAAPVIPPGWRAVVGVLLPDDRGMGNSPVDSTRVRQALKSTLPKALSPVQLRPVGGDSDGGAGDGGGGGDGGLRAIRPGSAKALPSVQLRPVGGGGGGNDDGAVGSA